ncbi:GlxA family transcriptional regulator [Agrobacterium leguminum]|uniref:GlxA family transcriptional regulator n=1 Tax=Agrobacterium leguminum TaxID=2792015 RepID=UPI003CE5375C
MTLSRDLTREVGFLVFDDFHILDFTGPLAVFETANGIIGRRAYELRTISRAGGPVTSTARVSVLTEPAVACTFDTVVIAGGEGSRLIARDAAHRDSVQSLAAHARRMTSVCTGAFILASAGLLNGRRATTHWRYATLLHQDYPQVRVESDHIFVRDGPVWSAAGVTAGIDLALALVEEDLGHDVARAIAQELVVYYRRPGGQSQFSAMLELEPASDRIRAALAYAREHLAEPLSVSALAEVACLSERQFGRAFRAETGETPARAIERLRAEAARLRLESGLEPVEVVGPAVGFSDPERMRRAFIRLYGQPPQAIRRAARSKKG